jgi:AraC-like DNA-binding protein
VPVLSKFIGGRFIPGQQIADFKPVLDQFLLTICIQNRSNPDLRVHDAIDMIVNKAGIVEVETRLAQGISTRQLRRLFEYYIGDTAKTFSKVIRFQQFLQLQPTAKRLKKHKLFLDAGYYDQAHFIREFKSFYGITPSRAFD